MQLGTLVGTLEDSFTSSEMVMSSSPASPRAQATLKAEKDRRQQLLRQLTQVRPPSVPTDGESMSFVRPEILAHGFVCEQLVAASGVNSSVASDETTSGASMEACQAKLGETAGASVLQDEASSAEWKHATLVRLRKFLRRQYRARKNKVVDSVSNSSASGADIADERAQLQQLAEDIKSIEFEIQMLSSNKTLVQDSKEPDGKDESVQGDSARSQRDTVKRVLGSAGSHWGSAASRKADSGQRLAGLHEGDEGDNAEEVETADELRGVRRNLLELYAEPLEEAVGREVDSDVNVGALAVPVGTAPRAATAAAAAGSSETGVAGEAHEQGSLVQAELAGKNHMQSVDECIQSIRAMGAKAVSAADSGCEEKENNSSPCKLERLSRQVPAQDPRERETNSSPSKIERMRRQQVRSTHRACVGAALLALVILPLHRGQSRAGPCHRARAACRLHIGRRRCRWSSGKAIQTASAGRVERCRSGKVGCGESRHRLPFASARRASACRNPGAARGGPSRWSSCLPLAGHSRRGCCGCGRHAEAAGL